MGMNPPKNRFRRWGAMGLVLIAATAVVAWTRAGLLDLPSAPSNLTPDSAGLAQLEELKRMDEWIRSAATPVGSVSESYQDPSPAASKVRSGIESASNGDAVQGLELIREGVRLDPENLVYSNAYRMTAFRLKREFLREAKARGNLIPRFPPHLDRQPMIFFEEWDSAKAPREIKLQRALAWVDEMLLFPALEIKAPASVEAVNILTGLIDDGHEAYVPALFARGLNHLHRPARLVWPDSDKTPLDAAARDIGRCVAIGRKLNVGTERLQATLALALGDAYVKAGKFNVARSWWQVAQNLSGDDAVQEAVRRRYAWRDEETLNRLEAELDRSRAELDNPMTDLAMMWK